jgi:hypothetical protein
MGRPLNKRFTGEFSSSNTGIRVWAYNPNTSAEEICYIKLQKGATSYNVIDSENRVFKVKLVDKQWEGGLALGEGVVKGLVLGMNAADPDSGDDETYSDSISIKKLYNRTCRAFDGKRYDWRLAEAGNRDVIILEQLD